MSRGVTREHAGTKDLGVVNSPRIKLEPSPIKDADRVLSKSIKRERSDKDDSVPAKGVKSERSQKSNIGMGALEMPGTPDAIQYFSDRLPYFHWHGRIFAEDWKEHV